jgi:hypothetical protein
MAASSEVPSSVLEVPRPNDFIVVTFTSRGLIEEYDIKIVTATQLIISSVDDTNTVKLILCKNMRDVNTWDLYDLPTIDKPISSGLIFNRSDYTIDLRPRTYELKSSGGSFYPTDILTDLEEKIKVNDYDGADRILESYKINLLVDANYNPEAGNGDFYRWPMENKTKKERFKFFNWLQYHGCMWSIDLLFYCYHSKDKTLIHDAIKWVNKYEVKLDSPGNSEGLDLLMDMVHDVFIEDNVNLYQDMGSIHMFYETAFETNRHNIPNVFQQLVERYHQAFKIKESLQPTTKSATKS